MLASHLHLLFLLSLSRRPPPPPLFPYTTLFRSPGSLRTWTAVRFARPGSRRHRTCRTPASRNSALKNRPSRPATQRSEEHTSELQSPCNLVCRLLLEKKKKNIRLIESADR